MLIIDHGSYLLVRRNYPPAIDKWWFPGRRIFKGELIFDVAIWKGKEESEIQLQPIELISVEESIFDENDGINVHTINFVVKMRKLYNSQPIVLDHTHSEFARFDKISAGLHQCVKRPLLKLNFPVSDNLK